MILHKCTSAHRLISSLEEIIVSARAGHSYPDWSDEFLVLCEEAAEATLLHLTDKWAACQKGQVDPDLFSAELSSVIQAWGVLHTFVKPVVDASTLRVPYPLVHFLSEHVGSLKAVQGSKIVIEIISELNYLQHRHTTLRRMTTALGKTIHQSGKRVPKLGFLGLPCSQSRGLFLNCLLYHEIGHFIAEERAVFSRKQLRPLADELRPAFKQFAEWAAGIVLVWMEELFADLVAVRLIGPAYTLAYMELLRLITGLDDDRVRTFEIDHPADSLRFREQLKILRKDGWEDHVSTLSQWAELKRITRGRGNPYRPPYEKDPRMLKVWKRLIGFLCEAKNIKRVHTIVNQAIDGRDNPRTHYARSAKAIRKCLEHGIVPSVGEEIPHPTAIINGGVFFWLSGMSGLYRTVPSRKKEGIKDRAFLENRVEMWCLKGIEDWLLKRKQKP
jgi:hypothetical protein